MNADTHTSEHGHVGGVHAVPASVLIGVWLALMALTVLTVAVTYVDLREYNIVVALLIAVVKATLVGLYFMHLRYDSPFHSLLMSASLLFVAIFIIIALLDTSHYQHMFELPPGSIITEQSLPK